MNTALRAYEQTKASSRVVKVRFPHPPQRPFFSPNLYAHDYVKYGAEMMESSVKTISRPVIGRLPVSQLDEFACRQLDRVRTLFSIYLINLPAPLIRWEELGRSKFSVAHQHISHSLHHSSAGTGGQSPGLQFRRSVRTERCLPPRKRNLVLDPVLRGTGVSVELLLPDQKLSNTPLFRGVVGRPCSLKPVGLAQPSAKRVCEDSNIVCSGYR